MKNVVHVHVPFPLQLLCSCSHEDALDGWRQRFYPRQPKQTLQRLLVQLSQRGHTHSIQRSSHDQRY